MTSILDLELDILKMYPHIKKVSRSRAAKDKSPDNSDIHKQIDSHDLTHYHAVFVGGNNEGIEKLRIFTH